MKKFKNVCIIQHFPANTKLLHKICTTSVETLRRWFNIVQMLQKCFVFTGFIPQIPTVLDRGSRATSKLPTLLSCEKCGMEDSHAALIVC